MKRRNYMKKRLAMLLAVIMLLSCMCMPVLAQDVGTKASGVVTAQAVKNGWAKVGSNWRYYVNGIEKKNGIYSINKQLFGFDAKGNLQKGFFKINNYLYFASSKYGPSNKSAIGYGIVVTGFVKLGDAYYYLDPARKGQARTGFVMIAKKLYYFNPNTAKQRRTKGWFSIGNYAYYVNADGTIATNTTIDGIKVGPNGATTDVYGMDRKASGYSSSTRYLILVNKTHHLVNVYKGSKGNWTAVKKNMLCTIGKRSTPSPSGSYFLNTKNTRAYGYKDFTGSTAFYCSRISSGNYFHSILYKLGSRNPYTAKIKDGALGKNKSNSCIRLTLANAKYIYDNCPRATRVIVYP